MILRNYFIRPAMLTVVLTLSAAGVYADAVLVSPPGLALSGAAGSTLQILVDLANTADTTEFLNGINPSGLPGFDPDPFDVTPFFTDPSVPFFLAPFGQPGSIATAAHLFDIDIPATVDPGLYSGSFTLQGGADGTSFDQLASGDFTLQVVPSAAEVPEPGSRIPLIAIAGLLVIGRFWSQRRRAF